MMYNNVIVKLNYGTLVSSHPSTEVYILGLPPVYLGGGGMAVEDTVKLLISFRSFLKILSDPLN